MFPFTIKIDTNAQPALDALMAACKLSSRVLYPSDWTLAAYGVKLAEDAQQERQMPDAVFCIHADDMANARAIVLHSICGLPAYLSLPRWITIS